MNSESKQLKPPYLSFVTLSNFLKGLSDGVIPNRIDKSLMPGQSGATQSYILSALAFLGMIEENGRPSPDLVELVKAKVEGDQARPVWKRIFEGSYGAMITGIDLGSSTTMQLQDKFRECDYGGDTVRKCHLFFLAVADAAGIQVAKHLRNVGRVMITKKAPKKAKTEVSDNANSSGSNGVDAEMPEMPGHNIAQIPLNASGDRILRLQAPTTVTSAELKRIQAWLGFQLIVEDVE